MTPDIPSDDAYGRMTVGALVLILLMTIIVCDIDDDD